MQTFMKIVALHENVYFLVGSYQNERITIYKILTCEDLTLIFEQAAYVDVFFLKINGMSVDFLACTPMFHVFSPIELLLGYIWKKFELSSLDSLRVSKAKSSAYEARVTSSTSGITDKEIALSMGPSALLYRIHTLVPQSSGISLLTLTKSEPYLNRNEELGRKEEEDSFSI